MAAIPAFASLLMTGIGTAVSVAGQLSQARAIRRQGEINARIRYMQGVQAGIDADTNRKASLANAKQVQNEAQLRAQLEQRRGRADRAKLMSKMSRTGLTINSASGTDLLLSNALESDFAQNMALFEGAKQAEGLLYRANNLSHTGKLSRRFGEWESASIRSDSRNRSKAATIGAFSSGLSGAGKFFGDMAGYYDNGTFTFGD